MIFQKFSKNLVFKNLVLKVSVLKSETASVFSVLANLASEYDGSNPCRFRDMFSRFFPNIFRKLGFEKKQKDLKISKL